MITPHRLLTICVIIISSNQAEAQLDTAAPGKGKLLVESLFKGGSTEGWRGANDGALTHSLAERRGEPLPDEKFGEEKAKPEDGKNSEFASGRHISLTEKNGDGKTLYFQAPGKFTGDLEAAYGGTLSFGIRQVSDGRKYRAPLVVLSSKDTVLFYFHDKDPTEKWETFEVPLGEGKGWFNLTSGKEVLAKKEDIEKVLTAVKELWIRAEYCFGPDHCELADVKLHTPTGQ